MIVIRAAGYSPPKFELPMKPIRLNLQCGRFGAWYPRQKLLSLHPVDLLPFLFVYR